MTHTPTAPLSALPRIIRDNLHNCRKHDVANATLVLSLEMLEELDGLIRKDGSAVSRDYQPIETAPKNATEVILRIPANNTQGYREMIGHWAQDLSGEEQPAFSGWFYDYGYGLSQITPAPTHWRSI